MTIWTGKPPTESPKRAGFLRAMANRLWGSTNYDAHWITGPDNFCAALLARGGLGQSGDTENSRLRRWLQSLHEDPSETGSDRLIEGARGPVRKS